MKLYHSNLTSVYIRGLFKWGLMDTGYLPFYFQGCSILSSLLPGILKFLFTFRDNGYLGKFIKGTFANL